ncbi:prophage tail fiber N-terminal domain-containing protein, partial [Salmonella enterica]
MPVLISGVLKDATGTPVQNMSLKHISEPTRL